MIRSPILEAALPKDFEAVQELPAAYVANLLVRPSVAVTYHTDGRVTFAQARSSTVTPWLEAPGVAARYWVGSEAKRAVTVVGGRFSVQLPDGRVLLEGPGGRAEGDQALMRSVGLLDLPGCEVSQEDMPEVLRLVADPEDVMELGPGALADGVVTFRRPVGWVPLERRPEFLEQQAAKARAKAAMDAMYRGVAGG